jgi:hypothetical protein
LDIWRLINIWKGIVTVDRWLLKLLASVVVSLVKEYSSVLGVRLVGGVVTLEFVFNVLSLLFWQKALSKLVGIS